MELRGYMEMNFPGVKLKPGLYHQWDIGIHFELAESLSPFKNASDELNPEYFHMVHNQANTIFNELFVPEDEIFLVTNLYQRKGFKREDSNKMKVYHRYVKNNAVRSGLKQTTLPYIFEDEEDHLEKCTTQFSLNCSKKDVQTSLLLKAISHQDFPPAKPRLSNPYGLYEPDVFFVNSTRNLIFYMYDDRGCEVIASDIEMIRQLYTKYRNWVDKHYREAIAERFNKE